LDILKQVEAGDLTPEEADRQLAGVGATTVEPEESAAPPPWPEQVDRGLHRLERQRQRMERHRARLERRLAHQRDRWSRRRFEGRLTVDDLIRLRLHGVSSDYVEEMREQLGDVPLDKLVELKVHGVTPEMVEELRESGVEEVSPDDVLRWKSAVKGSRFSDAMSSAMEVVGPYVTQLVESSLAEARRHIYEALRVDPTTPPEAWKSVDTAAEAAAKPPKPPKAPEPPEPPK
jgi:hypothetical protein